MKSKYLFILFIAVVIVQWFVLVKTIFNQEEILSQGTIYKFKTRPIDPTDPFRGKYITLNFKANRYKTNDSLWQRGETVYVYIKNDSLNFAAIDTVSKTILQTKQDYFIAETSWYTKRTKTLRLKLPFNRFYMQEFKAKPAEDIYRKANKDSLPNNCYAKVAIKDGNALIENVYINNVPIADAVENTK